jgi:hypothetical protein
MPQRIITSSRSPVSWLQDHGLGVTGSDVVVGRYDANVVGSETHMEVLSDLLFIEEAVVAAAHIDKLGRFIYFTPSSRFRRFSQ